MATITHLISTASLPPELVGVVASGLRDADFFTVSRALESFDTLHESVLREAQASNGTSVQLAFLRFLYEAGCGVGSIAEHTSFDQMVRLWEDLRMRRQSGYLADRSTLVISPVKADTVQVRLHNGSLVICAEYQRSARAPSTRAFYFYPQVLSEDADLDLYNKIPTFIRPSAHLFAFSGCENMVAILESDRSSCVIQLVYHTELPSPRLAIPAAWNVRPQDVRSDCCRLVILHCLLAMFLPSPARLVIYNWKTGVVLLVVQGRDIAQVTGFAFLSSGTFMLAQSDGLSVYCVPASPTSFSELERAWLGLPKLHASAQFQSLQLHASHGDPGSRSEITLRERMCLLLATVVNNETEETRKIAIFVKSAAILDACHSMP